MRLVWSWLLSHSAVFLVGIICKWQICSSQSIHFPELFPSATISAISTVFLKGSSSVLSSQRERELSVIVHCSERLPWGPVTQSPQRASALLSYCCVGYITENKKREIQPTLSGNELQLPVRHEKSKLDLNMLGRPTSRNCCKKLLLRLRSQ